MTHLTLTQLRELMKLAEKPCTESGNCSACSERLNAFNTHIKDLITRLIGLSEAVKQYADASEDSPHKPQVARTALEKYGVRDE